MAKYLATTPFFRAGSYYAAHNDDPLVFEIPDEETPSFKWYPLDKAAEAALQKLAAEKKVRVHKLVINPDEAPKTQVRVPPTVTRQPDDPDLLPAPLRQVMKTQAEKAAISGQRPSDREPNRK